MARVLHLDGGGTINRPPLTDPEGCLREFLEDESQRNSGRVYYDYKPVTHRDRLFPEDVAITLALNSRASALAVCSVVRLGHTLDLGALPKGPLHETSAPERTKLAELLAQVCDWHGFKASMATKMLHKKRPALIPVLDNKAIFGAYMNTQWGQPKRAPADSVGDRGRIAQALNFITADLVRPENVGTWPMLQAMAPERTLIEIFDMVWWIHFTRTERQMETGR